VILFDSVAAKHSAAQSGKAIKSLELLTAFPLVAALARVAVAQMHRGGDIFPAADLEFLDFAA
jgi:hypothetical protein